MNENQEDTYEWVERFQKEYADMYGYFVYMHVSPDGKKYIGYGHGEPEKRWRNGRGYNHSPRFTDAIKEFGWDQMQHTVLQTGLSLWEARELERVMILGENSADPEFGYNVQIPEPQEDGHWKVYQLIFPDGKMYVGRTAKPFETRWRSGSGYKGNREMYAAIQAVGWENVIKIKCCEELPEESAAAMEKFLIEVNHTTDPSRGYNKTEGGMKEKGNHARAEDVEKRVRTRKSRPPTAEELRHAERFRKCAEKRCVPVMNMETGKIYPSIKAAAKALGVGNSTVRSHLNKPDHTIHGIHLCRV